MTTLTAKTFSLQIPQQFESSRVFLETAQAATYAVDYVLQNPEFQVGLEATSEFDSRAGSSAMERLLDLISDFGSDPQLVARHEFCIEGQPSSVQEAFVDWEWAEKKARVHYFVGGLVIGEHCYLMRAYCETNHLEIYRELFLEMWCSLRLCGDRALALAERKAALEPILRQPDPAAVPALKPFAPPQQGAGCFAVGGFDLGLKLDACSSEICPSQRQLSLTLQGHLDPELPGYAELVGYEGEGLGFRLTLGGICSSGTPVGEFAFEYGRCSDHRAYLWDDGWDYSLEFSGLVTLKDGWVALRGWLSKQHDSQFAPVELELYYQLDRGALEWSQYRYLSLDETEGMPRLEVRYLTLSALDSETLPEAVLEFWNLQELRIVSAAREGDPVTRLALCDLTGIGILAELQELQIHHTHVKALPSEIGALTRLQRLSVTDAFLEDATAELWRLPGLRHLALRQNRLERVPEEGTLPNLESLDLAHNALRSLPDWVGQCPRLKRLSLEGNPWEHLPQGLLELHFLGLDIADKLRLFDFTYPGTENDVSDWNKETFFLRSQAAPRENFLQALRDSEFSPFEKALLEIARATVYFEHGEVEDYSRPGCSRFGGYPDLPEGAVYPCYDCHDKSYAYEFIAQLDCQELSPLQAYLPRQGTLYFFVDNWEQVNPLVLYTLEKPLSGQRFADHPTERWDDNSPYAAFRAIALSGWSLPSDYSAATNSHDFPGAAATLLEHEGLTDKISEQLNRHRDTPHHEVNGYVFTQHESPELQAALRLRGRPEEWMVLLKVASLGGFQWGDAGELFFVIHKSDLEKCEFGRVFAGVESS